MWLSIETSVERVGYIVDGGDGVTHNQSLWNYDQPPNSAFSLSKRSWVRVFFLEDKTFLTSNNLYDLEWKRYFYRESPPDKPHSHLFLQKLILRFPPIILDNNNIITLKPYLKLLMVPSKPVDVSGFPTPRSQTEKVTKAPVSLKKDLWITNQTLIFQLSPESSAGYWAEVVGDGQVTASQCEILKDWTMGGQMDLQIYRVIEVYGEDINIIIHYWKFQENRNPRHWEIMRHPPIHLQQRYIHPFQVSGPSVNSEPAGIHSPLEKQISTLQPRNLLGNQILRQVCGFPSAKYFTTILCWGQLKHQPTFTVGQEKVERKWKRVRAGWMREGKGGRGRKRLDRKS